MDRPLRSSFLLDLSSKSDYHTRSREDSCKAPAFIFDRSYPCFPLRTSRLKNSSAPLPTCHQGDPGVLCAPSDLRRAGREGVAPRPGLYRRPEVQ